MAELYRFFDGTVSDPRSYSADDFAEYFRQFIKNGVFNGGDELQIHSDNVGVKTFVRPGKAWINGYFYRNTQNLYLDHDVAHATLERIDRVVLRLDYGLRAIGVKVLTGVPGATPQPPELTRSANVHELSLAQVRVKAGTVSINPGEIADERFNGNLCGIVTHLFEKVDTTNIFQQFENEWNNWFGSVQDITNLVTKEQFDKFMETAGFSAMARSYRALVEHMDDDEFWEPILNDPQKVTELLLSEAICNDPNGEVFTRFFKERERFMERVFGRANMIRRYAAHPELPTDARTHRYWHYYDGRVRIIADTLSTDPLPVAAGIRLFPKINLDNVSVLKVDWENMGIDHSSNQGVFGISYNEDIYNIIGENEMDEYVELNGRFARRITTLDVSSLSGECYVGVIARRTGYSYAATPYVEIYNIWGE